jgi:hypothetical protein
MEEQQQNASAQGMGGAQAQAKEALHGLEAYLVPLFANLPHIPQGGLNFLVMIAPWYALIFGVLGLTALLGLMGIFGLGAMGGYGMMGYGMGNSLVMLAASIVSAILLLLAFKGLKAKHKSGWDYLFYSEIVGIIGGAVGAFMMQGYGLVGTAISALIGFYILFEIRGQYK